MQVHCDERVAIRIGPEPRVATREGVGEVSEIATTIASGVEQQRAATSEIARNVQQTSQAAQEDGGYQRREKGGGRNEGRRR